MSASELEQVRGGGRCSVTRMLHRTATRSHLTDRRRLNTCANTWPIVSLKHFKHFSLYGWKSFAASQLSEYLIGSSKGGKPEATFWADLLGRFCQIRPTAGSPLLLPSIRSTGSSS